MSPEDYNDYALKLIQQAVSDDILGYKTEQGAIVRYRVSTNDYVKGYPTSGIATLFKPANGVEYYKRHLRKEGIVDD